MSTRTPLPKMSDISRHAAMATELLAARALIAHYEDTVIPDLEMDLRITLDKEEPTHD